MSSTSSITRVLVTRENQVREKPKERQGERKRREGREEKERRRRGGRGAQQQQAE